MSANRQERASSQQPAANSPTRAGTRRTLLPAMAASLAALALGPMSSCAQRHHKHKKRRKRCDKHCKNDHKTCDRGCDILDGDSQHFCKQSCKVALSQCKSDC